MVYHHFPISYIIIHHYTSLYIIIHHYTSLYINIHHYTSLYINIHQYTSIYIIIHHYTSIYINIHHYTSLYINIHQYTSIYIIIHHYTSIYINIHQYTSIYIIIHHFTIIIHLHATIPRFFFPSRWVPSHIFVRRFGTDSSPGQSCWQFEMTQRLTQLKAAVHMATVSRRCPSCSHWAIWPSCTRPGKHDRKTIGKWWFNGI